LIQYLFTLTDQNDNPLYVGKKTFIIGLTTAVLSVFSVAKELLPNNKLLKYILTYRYSQDHIELLFSRIRKRYGLNYNNPNVLQFKTAMKQIILKNSFTPLPSANNIALDDDPVGNIFEIKLPQKKVHLTKSDVSDQGIESIENNYDELGDEMLLNKISILNNDSSNLDDQKLNILYYITGFVVRTISQKSLLYFLQKKLI